MAIAETAELAVLLKLRDELSGPLTTANSRIKELEATSTSATTRGVGGLQAGLAKGEKAATSFGGAMSNAGSKLKSFAFGPLGLLGVTGGLLTFGGAIEKGITKAQDFGAEVVKMSAATGLSTETTSALAAALDHYGISADSALRLTGFLEKNVGLLAARKDGIAGFEKSFGLALTDTNGKLLDANQLILQTADYFNNKSIPATTKAAALSKLYGRSWQELIPVLSAGRQGIQDAEEEAAKLGLTLTSDNIVALQKMKTATRDWGDALGGLELQIGLALIPSLTDMARTMTSFVSQHRDDIVGFFKSAAQFAGEAGDAIRTYFVPAFEAIGSLWAKLPEPVKQLVIAGAIGDRTIHYFFDVSPIKFAAGAIETIGQKVLGGFLQRGGTPANPLFVADVTGGLGGAAAGAAGAAEAGAGGLLGAGGILGTGVTIAGLIAFAAPIAVAAVITELSHRPGSVPNMGPTGYINTQGGSAPSSASSSYLNNQGGSQPTPTVSMGPVSNAPLGEHALDNIVAANNKANAIIGAGIAQGHRDMDKLDGTVVGAKSGISAAIAALHGPLNKFDADLLSNMHTLVTATKANDIAKAAAKIAADITKGAGSLAITEKNLDSLKARRDEALKNGQTALARTLDGAIKRVEAKIPGREYVQRQIDKAQAIYNSSEAQKRKLSDLQSIMAQLKARGDVHAANEIAKLITLTGAVNSLPSRIHLTVVTPGSSHPLSGSPVGAGKQGGGAVEPGVLYPIGEHGPEFFRPKVPGYVDTFSQAGKYLAESLHRAIGQTHLWRPTAAQATQQSPTVVVNLTTTARSVERSQVIAARYGPQFAG